MAHRTGPIGCRDGWMMAVALLGLIASAAVMRSSASAMRSSAAAMRSSASAMRSSASVERSVAASEHVFHVNQSARGASDRNPGTERAPFKTIQAACERATARRISDRLPVRIAVHRGIYRESIDLSAPAVRGDLPHLVVEGIEPDVVVSGADVWNDWTPREATNDLRAPWPYRWGLAALPPGWEPVTASLLAHPIVRRAEMVFVNGRRLSQVLSLGELRATQGRFMVDESRDPRTPGTLWMRPGDDSAKGTPIVEVAVRPLLLAINRMANVVVRRMVFRAAATPLQDAAIRVSGADGLLFEDLRIEDNNWNGLSVHESRDVTIRRVVANHNGAGGVGAWRVRRLRIEDVEASYNNWRGGAGGFTGWATGQKFLYVHDATFIGYRAVGNQATGLWFDTDLANVTVERAVLCENATNGLYLEAVQGPISVRDSVICRNGERGIFATAARGITLDRNVITANREHQIFIPWMDAEHVVRPERDYETGQTLQIRSADWVLSGNTIQGDGEALLFSVGNWPAFLTTFQSTGNRWTHASRADTFAVYRGIHAAPSRMDLQGWRALTGQDRTSSFTRAPTSPTPSERPRGARQP